MKLSKKLLALLLCVVMVLSLVPVVSAEESQPLATEDELVIYYTNDIHTYIDKDLSYDNIADLKTQTEATAYDVLLVDAGDHVQGTAYGSMDKGATIVELMEAAGYDVATLGNHEFDYGMERALEIATTGSVPYVSCNFYHEEDGVVGETVLAPYYVYERDDISIAIIGVTTPESFTKSTPAYFQDEEGNYIYGIAGGEDGSELYAAVQAAIDEVAGEVDLVIALAHLGDDPASQPWTSEELIVNTTGLDAVIDGHSHSTIPYKEVEDAEGNTVVLTQTGEYFNAIGRMVINLDTLAIETGLITLEEETVTAEEGTETTVEYVALDGEATGWTIGSNEEVAAIKDAWIAQISEQLGEVIGVSEVDMVITVDGTRWIRARETNLGDFCADALYYLFDNMGLDVDVAIMNGGGIRANAPAGEISYNTCKTVHTFGNVACLQTITGQQLLDALEWGAKNVGVGENGGFLQVSGITYEIHSYIESTVQADDKGVWIGGPTGEYKVKNVKIFQDGEWVDLDLKAEYNLAGYNYTLRDLGDGFAMFDGAVNVLDYVMEDYLVLANYVQSFPVDEETGLPTIGADSIYAEAGGEGRITIMGRTFDDVSKDAYYYKPVLWAMEKGVTAGTSQTTFSPNAGCTRAQIVTMIWAANGRPEPKTTVNPFTDVAETDYFYKAVLWAVENGITSGMSKTAFGPNVVCTRAHAVTFLYNAEGKLEITNNSTPFTDVTSDAYYADAVAWAIAEGITAGTSATTFGPNDTCTRGQIVTFLYKAQ